MNEEKIEKPLHERVFDVIKTLEDASEHQNILFEVFFALERNNNDIEASVKDLKAIRLKYEARVNGEEPPIVPKMIRRFTYAILNLETITEWC